MSEAVTADTEAQLDEFNYGVLMNVARSASKQFGDVDIDTHAPKKPKLIEDMSDAGIEHVDGSWEHEGEEIELLEVQTPDSNGDSNEPKDKTVLYCLTRAETTEDRVQAIREALEAEGFELRATAGGDKYSIVLPAPETEEVEEDGEEEDAEESDESESDEVEEDDDPSEGDEEETDESADEAEENEEEQESEDEDDDEQIDGVDREVIRERLEERNKTSEGPKGQPPLYQTAKELNIDGRSDMTKSELIDAILDARAEE